MNEFNKVIMLATVFSLSACTNLSAVRQYSETANKSLEKVPVVISDFSSSCNRRAQYQPADNKPDCDRLSKAEPPLLEIVSVLQKYIVSLGKLASDDVVTYTEDLDKLEKEINGLEKFDKDKVSAVTSVAKYLTKLATDASRRNAIESTIKDNNNSILIITSSISKIVSNDYKNLLEIEKSAIEKHYKKINATYKETEPLAVLISTEERNARLEEINNKIKAIEPLATLIEKVGEGHKELTAKSNELDSKELIDLIKSYVDDAKPILKQVKDAYK